jgi:hypothetical protein
MCEVIEIASGADPDARLPLDKAFRPFLASLFVAIT